MREAIKNWNNPEFWKGKYWRPMDAPYEIKYEIEGFLDKIIWFINEYIMGYLFLLMGIVGTAFILLLGMSIMLGKF